MVTFCNAGQSTRTFRLVCTLPLLVVAALLAVSCFGYVEKAYAKTFTAAATDCDFGTAPVIVATDESSGAVVKSSNYSVSFYSAQDTERSTKYTTDTIKFAPVGDYIAVVAGKATSTYYKKAKSEASFSLKQHSLTADDFAIWPHVTAGDSAADFVSYRVLKMGDGSTTRSKWDSSDQYLNASVLDANGDVPSTFEKDGTYFFKIVPTDKEGNGYIGEARIPINVAEVKSGPWNYAIDKSWYDEDSPVSEYTLTNAAQLAGFGELVADGHDFAGCLIRLGDDIDLNNCEWPAIGTKPIYKSGDEIKPATNVKRFAGTFDGENHVVSGLYNSGAYADCAQALHVAGLFGVLDSSAVVKDLTISGTIDISADNSYDEANLGGLYVGGLAGYAFQGISLSNCVNKVNVKINQPGYCSGFIGHIERVSVGGSDPVKNYSLRTTLSDCVNTGSVAANTNGAGGLLGVAYNVDAQDCANTGSVSFTTATATSNVGVGGLFGMLYASNVRNAFNTGNIAAISSASTKVGVGGIVGVSNYFRYSLPADSSISSTYRNLYNRGKVERSVNENTYGAGGLIGTVSHVDDDSEHLDVIADSYNIGEVDSGSGAKGLVLGSIVTKTDSVGTPKLFNNYYESTLGDAAVSGVPADGCKVSTDKELKSVDFIDVLNGTDDDVYPWSMDLDDANDGYPVFASSVTSVDVFDLGNATLTVGDAEWNYDAVVDKPEITVRAATGATLRNNADYVAVMSDETGIGTDVGSVTVVGNGSYTGTIEGAYSVNRRDISKWDAPEIDNQVYTKQAITPAVELSAPNGKTLTEGADYLVVYLNNTNVGTATAAIVGKGSYQGTLRATFKILADTSALEAALQAAKDDFAATEVSEDGADVDAGSKWVVNDDKAAFQEAIEAAEAVKEAAQSATAPELTSQSAVDAAKGALDAAQEAFETVKKDGAKVADTSGLEASIKAAKAAVAAVRQSADGADVAPGAAWAAPEDVKPVTDAVNAAEALLEEAEEAEGVVPQATLDAQAKTVDNAVAALEAATKTAGRDASALDAAITAAQADLDATAVSGDGSDVAVTGTWVTQAQADALASAIATAKELAADGAATQAAVNAGAASLAKAQEDFDAAKQAGTAPAKWQRLSGDDALGTMAQIVSAGFGSSDTVVIATNDGYWDALSASALAGASNAPVLLTDGASLSPQTAEQVKRLGATSAYIVGGTAAVSADVEMQVGELGVNVTRLAGDNAVGTALAINAEVGSAGGVCVIATSDGYWDALAASPYAYSRRAPIYLTDSTGALPDAVLAAIRDAGYSTALIAGGSAVVPDSTADALAAAGLAVVRQAGDNAYGTAIALAQWELSQGMRADGMGVATADGYWDALSGAALCGRNGSVLVLADGWNTSAIDQVVKANAGSIAGGYVFGGPSAVPDSVLAACEEATR